MFKTFLQSSRSIRLSFILASAMLLIVIAVNEWGFAKSSAAAQALTISSQRRAAINYVIIDLLDAETGQRGYLLAGEKSYLTPYRDALGHIDLHLRELAVLYADDTQRESTISQLSSLVGKKLGEMAMTIQLHDSSAQPDRWLDVVRTDAGRQYMDAIRAISQQLLGQATRDRDSALAKIRADLQISRASIALSGAFGLLALYFFLRQTRKINALYAGRERWLQEQNENLESLVKIRSEHLSELATHLQRVQEREREHLARELHDELGALLTAAKLDVARLKSRLPDDKELRIRLQHLTEALNSGISLKRRIIEDLRPSSLSKLGLVPALEILTGEFAQRSQLPVQTNFEPVQGLSADADITLYRVVQESLTNIAKYAEANQIRVTLHQYPEHVELMVSDDGKGFEPAFVDHAAHGIDGMRHRLVALRGSFEIASEPGKGTRITVTVPTPRRMEIDRYLAQTPPAKQDLSA